MIAYILIRKESTGMWQAKASIDGKPCVSVQPTRNGALSGVLESLKNAAANGRRIDPDYAEVIQVHLPDNPGPGAA